MTIRQRVTLAVVVATAWITGAVTVGGEWLLYSSTGIACIAAAAYLDWQLGGERRDGWTDDTGERRRLSDGRCPSCGRPISDAGDVLPHGPGSVLTDQGDRIVDYHPDLFDPDPTPIVEPERIDPPPLPPPMDTNEDRPG